MMTFSQHNMISVFWSDFFWGRIAVLVPQRKIPRNQMIETGLSDVANYIIPKIETPSG